MQIGEILNKLQKVKRLGNGNYSSLCPAHDDKKSSLNIKKEGDKILIKCHAGCTSEQITESLGINLSDLFDSPSAKTKITPKIVTEYDYKDEKGNVLFQTVRLEPKDFRQRCKNDDGEWVWNLEGVRRVLYHLDELEKVPFTNKIYIVEGEKDADNLWTSGVPATTSPMGASAWLPEYANSLLNRKIVIIPDKDVAGYQYAKAIIKSLSNKAIEIKVIILPDDDVKDISDWLDKEHEVSELDALEQSPDILDAPIIYKSEHESIYWEKKIDCCTVSYKAENISNDRTGIHARTIILMDDIPLAWSYFNIERDEDRTRLSNNAHKQIKGELSKTYTKEDIKSDLDKFCLGLWNYKLSFLVPEELAGFEDIPPITFLLKPYIVSNGGTIIYAPPGRGKSYTALLWAISVDAGINLLWNVVQTKTLFINLERSKESVQRRLSMVNNILGLHSTRPLLIINARGKTLADVAPSCRKAISKYNVGLIVLDSISRAGMGDLTEGMSGNRIIDQLSALCPSWLALGHTPRQSDNHLYGSIMQDAGADICVQLNTQTLDDETLGIGWSITKQNDIGRGRQEIKAFEFDESYGLKNIREPKPFEFPDIEGKSHTQSMPEVIKNFILNQDNADATATEIADFTGFNRANISTYLSSSGDYVRTRRIGKSQYYGVKNKVNTLDNIE